MAREYFEHYYGDGCPEHRARQEGVPVGEYREPVHPRSEDRWTRAVAAGQLTIAVDASGCYVIHTPGGSVTITNLAELQDALTDAKQYRDVAEERWQGRSTRRPPAGGGR